MDLLNGVCKKIANGMCRLSMTGGIAIKTSNGYKTYDLKKNRLMNCNNFVFDIGEEFFFVIPTNKVEPGDIILVGGHPKCVISNNGTSIKVVNYETGTVEDILPERHVFMGNTYFYGKIISMFGSDLLKGGKKGTNKIMQYMMMSEMMNSLNNGASNGGNGIGAMLPFMMMNGNMGNLFDGFFDFDIDDTDEEDGEAEVTG